ncbi:hypothetical protein ACGFNY_43925 [Streptomyces chartreusis]|uniref:hypothetical protein n=1 Tax=Streptomyces chartreusis TaxID=1969 RepID=UPI00371DE4E4
MVSELDDALEDFDGFRWIPGLGKVLDGIAEMDTAARTGRITADGTQSLLSIHGNPSGPDLPYLLSLVVKTLTGPDNPVLNDLPDETRKQLQHLGEMHAFETAEYAIRDHTNEAAALITSA